ncbi:MAG: RNA polymerase sigma factor [Planctomycetota bacterium]
MALVSTSWSEAERGLRPVAPDASEPDDRELALRSARGDHAAFACIYARHHASVYQVACRLLLDPSDGADVTQEAFLKAWERVRELREPEHFRGWLLRIVVNTALNWRARRKREKWVLRRLADHEVGPPASVPAMSKEARDLVEQALGKLSKKLRTAVVLRYVAQLPYTEVARAMNCGEPTARTRVSRGLVELEGHLKCLRGEA